MEMKYFVVNNILNAILALKVIMEQLGLYLHSIRGRQIKNTLRKIDRRTFIQMKKSRSEGFEIAFDYTQQLKRVVRRSKSEKLTFMQRKDERRRLMTQFNISTPKQQQQQTDQINIYKISEQRIGCSPAQKQIEEQASRVAHDKVVSNKLIISNKMLGNREYSLRQQQHSSQKLFQKQSIISISEPSIDSPGPVKKKKFLPMLQLYIKQQQCLKEMNSQQKQIRNLIVTMMVLAINRRTNNRLYDALDILIQTQVYFPQESREMIHLKSVWIELIGKIYQEIKKTLTPKKQTNRWKKTARRSSAKLTLQLKQRKTIVIRSLASRKAFFDKCSQNLRKSKLIYESTYSFELKNQQNLLKTDSKGNRLINKMENNKCIVTFPQPKQAYPQSEDIQNYAIILINKDAQSNIFPLNYPESVQGFIGKQQYIDKIIKINSYLIPSTRCLDYQSTLFIHYQLIFSMFLLLLISTILVIYSSSPTLAIISTVISIAILCIMCLRLHRKTSHSKQRGQISHFLMKCCKQWEYQYEQIQLKCALSNQLDIILLSFPIDAELNEQESSQGFNQLQRQQNRKCSIKLPFTEMDHIDEKSIDEDEDEQDQQFWTNIERMYKNGLYQQQIMIRQKTDLSQSEDNKKAHDVELQLVKVKPQQIKEQGEKIDIQY